MLRALLALLPACVVPDVLYAPVDPADPEPVRFTVPLGTTAREVGPLLVQAGLAESSLRWRILLEFAADGDCVKAGEFELRRDMSLPQIHAVLCGPPLPDDVPFTVVEGWRVRDIDAALAAAGFGTPGAYAALASDPARFQTPFPLPEDTLEGYLFPDTYQVSPSRYDARAFVARQLEAFATRFWSGAKDDLGTRSLHEVVIVASMVEREEPTPARRPLVAGVIWKRLDNGWELGVDATSRYTLPDWNHREAFLSRLRDPKDPYNTRLRRGLPPTPIGNPGLAALEAAVHPEDSPYWYYLHDARCVTHFARTGAEHEANRRRYDVW
ncbi:MAG: endolytic transglycosylase MltG [Deltaproteobacteria bacterium]|nr:endolytic transglycosylase MltG [Deltaproteobacteria bacterium]